MKIEDAIKQKKFESSFHKAFVNLLYTANWHRDKQSEVFHSFGILPQHFNILRIIKGKHPEATTPGYIKEVMIDKGHDITRLIDKLNTLGWIRRENCKENRRKVNILLTETGMEMLEKMNSEVKKFSEQLNNKISADEAEQLSNLLDKIRS